MNRPREWKVIIDEKGKLSLPAGYCPDDHPDLKIIVEKSAFLEAIKEKNEMEDHWRAACLAGDELKSQLYELIEAVEFAISRIKETIGGTTVMNTYYRDEVLNVLEKSLTVHELGND